jgi:hypothetical protein
MVPFHEAWDLVFGRHTQTNGCSVYFSMERRPLQGAQRDNRPLHDWIGRRVFLHNPNLKRPDSPIHFFQYLVVSFNDPLLVAVLFHCFYSIFRVFVILVTLSRHHVTRKNRSTNCKYILKFWFSEIRLVNRPR